MRQCRNGPFFFLFPDWVRLCNTVHCWGIWLSVILMSACVRTWILANVPALSAVSIGGAAATSTFERSTVALSFVVILIGSSVLVEVVLRSLADILPSTRSSITRFTRPNAVGTLESNAKKPSKAQRYAYGRLCKKTAFVM